MWLDSDFPYTRDSDGKSFVYCQNKSLSKITLDPKENLILCLSQIAREGYLLNESNIDPIKHLSAIITFKQHLEASKTSTAQLTPLITDLLRDTLLKRDNDRIGAPTLPQQTITDPNAGLWELYPSSTAQPTHTQLQLPPNTRWEARDPRADLKTGEVAIDFGTSSTVVAIKQNNQKELIRVGLSDWLTPPKPEHNENPTALQLKSTHAVTEWLKGAHLPRIARGAEGVVFSHEARATIRDASASPAQQTQLACSLTDIKQWCLQGPTQPKARLRLPDAGAGEELELEPLGHTGARKSPNPVELYAYLLGLYINHRARGFHLKYYMSFPVDYPGEVKRQMAQSFERGIRRTLPPTLLERLQPHEQLHVRELATEPAAFAISALRAEVILSAKLPKVTFAVFDLGGGTADFCFGTYRLATPQEEERGYEEVVEYVGAAGDRHLGGEYILWDLAYKVFSDNLTEMLKHGVLFEPPPTQTLTAGTEALHSTDLKARANRLRFVEALRPLWERKTLPNTGAGSLTVAGLSSLKSAEPIQVTLVVSADALGEHISRRLLHGLKNFLSSLRDALPALGSPKEILVLRAGNACRSPYALDLFGEPKAPAKGAPAEPRTLLALAPSYIGDRALRVTPLLGAAPSANPAVNIKTGVALGLLDLLPSGNTLVIGLQRDGRQQQRGAGDALQFFVGVIKRRRFEPTLTRGHSASGWVELGPIKAGEVRLAYTESSLAISPEGLAEDAPELRAQSVALLSAEDGQVAFVRMKSPKSVELCAGPRGGTPHAKAQALEVALR